MVERHVPDALLSFPCIHEFKAFGPATDEAFQESVFQAVNQIVSVGRDAVRTRLSSGGRYQCITVLVRLENSAQLTGIYDILRGIEGLRYLL
jgi:putative lipoic acid-binding regulatory protein